MLNFEVTLIDLENLGIVGLTDGYHCDVGIPLLGEDKLCNGYFIRKSLDKDGDDVLKKVFGRTRIAFISLASE